jgi:hypothetical protein
VFVGVSSRRRRLLIKNQFSVPDPVPVRALIDTGADVSGFTPRVFTELDLTPVAKIDLLTPSTPHDAPHKADLYDVTLHLVAEGRMCAFPDSRVMAADCWLPGEGIEALIGRDILDLCFFQYFGQDRAFSLAFEFE